ncbi:MAG: ribosome biogenesis GTPase Der [Cytophagales bacterium]|nr:MAG: ribosome biogenesis GTPase Der [Cytophagales bacterium]
MGAIIAVVGRPNVGKSTFFNRLTESRLAIMDDVSGVTRDRLYGQASWGKYNFTLVDTGGYVVGSDDVFEGEIRHQVEVALEEADVIIFVVDAQIGVTDMDKEFANVVRRYKKNTFIAVNKIDEPINSYLTADFYQLGLGDRLYPISSANGSGTGEILEDIIKILPEPIEMEDNKLPKIAILGRPNVGKSSFVNVLTGQNRSIVTDIAGTTRDALHTRYNAFGKEFILIDTAGIRKKSKVHDDIEFYSVMRALRVLETTDVCVIMVDASRGLESQDVNLIGLADKKGKGIVIMVNKWDLIEKDSNTINKITTEIEEKIKPMTYIPIIFTSVTNKQRIFQTMELALEVYANKFKKISTSSLNNVILEAIEKYPPPALKGKYVKIKYITQLPEGSRPTFLFFCNLPQYIKLPYQRYLENKLRESFDFKGVPIQLFFRKK